MQCIAFLFFRIHEAVQNIRKLGDRSISSMLLDLDERYVSAYLFYVQEFRIVI